MYRCPECGGETCFVNGRYVCNGANDCDWEQSKGMKCLLRLGMGAQFELNLTEAIAVIGLLGGKRVQYAGQNNDYKYIEDDFEIKIQTRNIVTE